MTRYICFDTETTGLNSQENNLLTVCFIILEQNEHGNLIEIDRLNISLQHEKYNVTIKALEINKIDLIKHHHNSIHLIEAKNKLLEFLKKNKLNYCLIPIGHNVKFIYKHNSYNIIIKDMEVNKIELIKHHNESITI